MPYVYDMWVPDEMVVINPTSDRGWDLCRGAESDFLELLGRARNGWVATLAYIEQSIENTIEAKKAQAKKEAEEKAKAKEANAKARAAIAGEVILASNDIDWYVPSYFPQNYDYDLNVLRSNRKAVTAVLLEYGLDFDVHSIVSQVPPRVLDGEPCSCKACKTLTADYKQRKALKKKDVKHHGFNPGWSPRYLGNENRQTATIMGVELETDQHSYKAGARYESELQQEIVSAFSRPEGLWESTNDSSISGIEFVSHPATLGYWRRVKPSLEQMFRSLVHAGYRSHDNDQCGMHISVNTETFMGRSHLARFMWLLNVDKDWTIEISQRTESSSGDWAQLDLNTYRGSLTRATQYMNGDAPDNRYVALNNPADGTDRFEFRLPRGTLNPNRFFKNLEWTHSMIEFTRQDLNSTIVLPSTYCRWLQRGPIAKNYPNLISFLNEKGLMTEVA